MSENAETGRDSGHSLVPAPPERMTGVILDWSILYPCAAETLPAI